MKELGKQTIAVGKKVQVINQSYDGQEFIEGYARIIGMDGSDFSDGFSVYCSVKFDDDLIVYRWIRRIVYS